MSNLLRGVGQVAQNGLQGIDNALGPTRGGLTTAPTSGTIASGTVSDAPTLPTPPPSITSPAAPQAPAPIPTPDASSPAVQEAARRAQRASNNGRAATIFASTLGGGSRPTGTADFSKTTLGAG